MRIVYSKLYQNAKRRYITISVVLQIQNGWTDPDTMKAKPYLTVKDSLTLSKGLILKDLRVVVTLTLRFQILNILHQGHIGIERTQLHARSTVY